jgi:two-component system chemotaxis response regulator CheB
MLERNLVVIGGSAASLSPLSTLVSGLPASFPACVLIAIHSSAESPGHLARILERRSHLPVALAVDGRPIQPGVFLAPTDHHLIVTPGEIHVTHGPKENIAPLLCRETQLRPRGETVPLPVSRRAPLFTRKPGHAAR